MEQPLTFCYKVQSLIPDIYKRSNEKRRSMHPKYRIAKKLFGTKFSFEEAPFALTISPAKWTAMFAC